MWLYWSRKFRQMYQLHQSPLRKKATIHQVTPMLVTSKDVWTRAPSRVIIKVLGHQYLWLAGWLCLGSRTFLEVANMAVTWCIVASLPSAHEPTCQLQNVCLCQMMYALLSCSINSQRLFTHLFSSCQIIPAKICNLHQLFLCPMEMNGCDTPFTMKHFKSCNEKWGHTVNK